MQKEKGKTWFWGSISLFLCAMLLLVFAGDWILFITAWELMGTSSFLLIATWHQRQEAREGAIKAFMLTRFTDMFLYVGVFIMVLTFKSLHILQPTGQYLSTFGSVCLLIAVMGKSAQVPFQSWLSGAMAGPTPVSALLHSATMVAAGVILLFRVFPLLNIDALYVIGLVGGITILLTGFTAITARDVKQLLAASTSSQLGFMLLAIGAGSPGAALAHWIAHAFLKANLFMGAGVFQHVYHSTSFKDINGTGKKLQVTFACFTIAALGLSGIPPLIAYWSKDGILAATSLNLHNNLFFAVATIGAFFTAVYMGKAVRRLWSGKNDMPINVELKWMLTGLLLLIVFVVFGGFFLEHLVKFAGYEIPSNTISKITGIAAAVLGLVAGWYVKESWFSAQWWNVIRTNYPIAGGYQKLVAAPTLKLAALFYQLELMLLFFVQNTGIAFLSFARSLYGGDGVLIRLTNIIGLSGLQAGRVSRSFEEKSIEAGVYGIASSVKATGKAGKKLQTGLVHKELAVTIAGVLILVFVLIVMIAYG